MLVGSSSFNGEGSHLNEGIWIGKIQSNTIGVFSQGWNE